MRGLGVRNLGAAERAAGAERQTEATGELGRAMDTSDGSGVPKVGGADCIEIEAAKVPNSTGAPLRITG